MKRSRLIPVSALGLVLVACSGKLDLGGGDDGGFSTPQPDGGEATIDSGSSQSSQSTGDGGGGTSIADSGLAGNDAQSTGTGTGTGTGSVSNGQWIAFDSNRETIRGIYLVHPDGTGLLRLTAMTTQESEPAFSPDGTKLAFSGGWYEGSPTQIYVRDLVTGAMQQLTSRPTGAHQPAWSPDGSLIAYTDIPANPSWDAGVQPAGSGDLYVINADGTNERDVSGPITINESATYPYAYPMSPAFTRDSKRILVSAEEAIYSLALDGSGLLEVVGGPTLGTETPAISWDGTLAIFAQWNGAGEGLLTISSAGYAATTQSYGNPTLLVAGAVPIAYRKPTWSSTGGVAFEEENGNVANLAVLSGSTAINVSAGPTDDRNPAWAPPTAPAYAGGAMGTCPATCTVGDAIYDCGSKTLCNCPSGVPAQVPVTCEGPASAQKVVPPGTGPDAGSMIPPHVCCN